MPRSRLLGVTGTTPPTPPRSRLLRVTGTGSLAAPPIAPRSRLLRVTGSGAAAVVVNPLSDLANVEPESLITITPTLLGGLTADAWSARVVSGLPAGVEVLGSVVTLRAPSHINGGTTTIGVRATKDGTISAEATMTVQVLPQTEWLWDGTAWLPNVVVWL